jgi:hypothetical protein
MTGNKCRVYTRAGVVVVIVTLCLLNAPGKVVLVGHSLMLMNSPEF